MIAGACPLASCPLASLLFPVGGSAVPAGKLPVVQTIIDELVMLPQVRLQLAIYGILVNYWKDASLLAPRSVVVMTMGQTRNRTVVNPTVEELMDMANAL
jgi:hypothetical protein